MGYREALKVIQAYLDGDEMLPSTLRQALDTAKLALVHEIQEEDDGK
jgi:hypothetical protein